MFTLGKESIEIYGFIKKSALIRERNRKMEKATVLYDLDNIRNNAFGYERIYFGGEFCQLRIPKDREIEMIIDFAQKEGKKLTLLTPVCNNEKLNKVRSILEKYGKVLLEFDFEVVINDWGVMELLNQYPEISKVAGRSLFHYKKDPRISKISVVPEELKYNVAKSQYVQEFLIQNHCGRMEFDNLAYLLNDLNFSEDIRYSVYVPYVCVTTTRLCRMQDENLYNVTNELMPVRKCDRKCEKYVLKLKNEDLGQSLFVRGNTQYYLTQEYDEEWYESKNINRLVYNNVTNVKGK